MSRSRVTPARLPAPPQYRASAGGSSTNAGALAAATWIRNRGTTPPGITRWHVEIALDVVAEPAPSEFDEATATRFHLDIYTEEWGFFFCHAGHSSWIRVTDIAFVHGRDDYQLLSWTPPLKDVATLLRRIEREYNVKFQRELATVKTNIQKLEPAIRAWVAAL